MDFHSSSVLPIFTCCCNPWCSKISDRNQVSVYSVVPNHGAVVPNHDSFVSNSHISLLASQNGLGLADTGCSTHIFNQSSLKLMKSVWSDVPVRIATASGSMVASKRGFHPALGEGLVIDEYEGPTLISVGQLLDTHDLELVGKGVFKFAPLDGKGPTLVAERNAANLFPLREVSDDLVAAMACSRGRTTIVWTVHEILSHASEKVICAALDRGEFHALGLTSKDVRDANLGQCLACAFGKMKAGHGTRNLPSFPLTDVRAGDHLHVDLVFVKGKTRKDQLVYLFALDGMSKYIHVQRLPSKDAPAVVGALRGLMEFHRRCKATRGEPDGLAYLHSDVDSTITKLAREGSLLELGIQHVHTAADVHERAAERAVGSIRPKMRAVIAGLPYSFPLQLVSYLFEDVILSHNQTPHSTSGGRTPLAMVTGVPVDGDHFQVPFGTVGMFHNPKPESSLSPTGELGIVVGRQPHSRAMKVFLLQPKSGSAREVARDKVRPLAVPFPDKVETLIAELNQLEPAPGLQDELASLETPPRRVVTPLNVAPGEVEDGLSFEGVTGSSTNPSTSGIHGDKVLAVAPRSNHSGKGPQGSPAVILDPFADGPFAAARGADHSVGRSSKHPRLGLKSGDTAGNGVNEAKGSEEVGITTESSNAPAVLGNHSIEAKTGAETVRTTGDGVRMQDGAMTKDSGSTSPGLLSQQGWGPLPDAEGVEGGESQVSGEVNSSLGGSRCNTVSSSSAARPQRIGTKPDYARLNKVGTTGTAMLASEFALASWAASGLDRAAVEAAVQTEVNQLIGYKVFEAVNAKSMSREDLRQALATVMLLTEKIAADGKFLKVKGRFVIKGFLDSRDNIGPIDSPTVSQDVVMLTLNIAASFNFDTDVFDIRAAFLEADLGDEMVLALIDKDLADMLVLQMPELESGRLPDGNMVVRLRRALYGLKEAPRRWYDTLAASLRDMGFSKSKHDECLFMKRCKEGMHYVLVHVDDMLSTGPKSSMVKLREGLKRRFRAVTETLNQDRFNYLGMTVERHRKQGVIELTQVKYIDNVIARLLLEANDVSPTPADANLFVVDESSEPLGRDLAPIFTSVVMLMLYITKTRPDIKCAVVFLTTRLTKSTAEDWDKMMRIGKYLNGSRDLPLRITASDMILVGAADASFAVHTDMKSHTGMILWLGNGFNAPIVTSSKKQSLTTRSSTEAELVALDTAAHDAVWVRQLLEEMGFRQKNSTTIQQDNKSCILLANRGHRGRNTRAVEIKYFWISEQVERGSVKLEYIETDKMLADGFTKALTGSAFRRWRNWILNLEVERSDTQGRGMHKAFPPLAAV